MKCKLFIVAQTLIVDFQSKRVSAINILEDFKTANFPFPLPMALIIVLEKEGETETEVPLFLQINVDSLPIIRDYKINIYLPLEAITIKSITNLGAIIIPGSGKLSFSINDSTGKVYGEYSINIVGDMAENSATSSTQSTAR